MGNFFHAVNRLREVLDRLVHQTIMSSKALMRLFYKVISVYEQTYGRTEISLLMDAFATRIAEHCASVRKYALTSPEQRVTVTAPEEWGPGSANIVSKASQGRH